MNDKLRAAAAIVLALALFSAIWVLLYRVYSAAVGSQSLTIPVLVAVFATLGLGRLHPRLRLGSGAVVILVCLVAYTFDFPRVASRDVVATEYTTLSIATGRGTSLDDYPELLRGGIPYYVQETPRGIRSGFAIGPALVAWPVYLAAPLSSLPRPELVHRLGNFSAILIGLASVWLVFRIATRLESPVSPALLALAYGVGTSHWGISASALWLHGPGELWVLGAIDRVIDEDVSVSRRLAALGACMALAVFSRPQLGVGLLVLAAVTLLRFRSKALIALASAAAIALPLVLYHVQTYGSILGAYATRSHGMSLKLPTELAETLFWLIASTSRGVFWYEPVVLFTLLVALARLNRRKHRLALTVGLAGFLATAIVYASWYDWSGGVGYGPRYMTDALPWWILATACIGIQGRWFRNVTASLIVVGALVNVVSVVGPGSAWDVRPSLLVFPERMESMGDSQLLVASLGATPWKNNVRTALEAERTGDRDTALSSWEAEWRARPWHQFAAFQMAELMLRTDRLDQAMAHVEVMTERWPQHSYVLHLNARLPAIVRFLESDDWVRPIGADASRNPGRASSVHDAKLGTRWTSLPTRQRKGDWLEFRVPPATAIRGVVIVAAPDFGEGPQGVEMIGTTSAGERIVLVRSKRITVLHKGWVAMRFPAVELESVRIVLLQNRGVAWSVAEARLLVAAAADR